MDYKVFATKKDAEAKIAQMVGWDAKASQVVDYDGNPIWVVEVKINSTYSQYLRSDGYVR